MPPVLFYKYTREAFPAEQVVQPYRNGNEVDITYELKETWTKKGTFQAPIFALEGPAFLAWAMGKDTVTGVGDPYTHTLSLLDGKPVFSLETGYYTNDSGVVQYVERGIDAQVGQLTIEGQVSKPLLMTPDVVAASATVEVSPATVSFTDTLATEGPYTWLNSVFTITGPTDASTIEAEVQKFALVLNNNLRIVYGPNQLTPIGVLAQARDVTVTADLVWTSGALEQLTYMGGNSGTSPDTLIGTGSWEVKSTANNSPEHSLDITLPNIDFTIYRMALNADAQLAMGSMTARAIRVGATLPVAAVAKNSRAAAYTA